MPSGNLFAENRAQTPLNRNGSPGREVNTALSRCATMGNPACQFVLGLTFKDGLGGFKDQREAFRLIHQAAEQGFSPAIRKMGMFYLLGNGVPANEEKATHWFRQAAEMGDEEAAILYLHLMDTSGEVLGC